MVDKYTKKDEEDEEEDEEDEEGTSTQTVSTKGNGIGGLMIFTLGIGFLLLTVGAYFSFNLLIMGAGAVIMILGYSGIATVSPRYRGLVERMGKYISFKDGGLVFLIPFVDRMRYVNITEQMVTAEPQEVITKDSLNTVVDAQIYFKVKSDEKSVKASQYNVDDYSNQIVALTRTTVRSIFGNMTLTEANSGRQEINKRLQSQLEKETKAWGIEVVRAELSEITPPKEVQAQMNKVVIAEKEKKAAIDFATAAETQADGQKRAAIKQAEGKKQAQILEAEGQSQAIEQIANATAKQIKLVNESAKKYFVGNAVKLKQLEVTQASLENNSKVIVPEGSQLVNVIGDLSNTPLVLGKEKKEK